MALPTPKIWNFIEIFIALFNCCPNYNFQTSITGESLLGKPLSSTKIKIHMNFLITSETLSNTQYLTIQKSTEVFFVSLNT